MYSTKININLINFCAIKFDNSDLNLEKFRPIGGAADDGRTLSYGFKPGFFTFASATTAGLMKSVSLLDIRIKFSQRERMCRCEMLAFAMVS